jgi:glucose/arabinose dehydrogenase
MKRVFGLPALLAISGPPVLLPGCYSLVPAHSVSGAPIAAREPDPAAVQVPHGYRVEVVASGLTFPAGAAVDEEGHVYVVEAGYSYDDVWNTPRLLRIDTDGTKTSLATGTDAPWTGVDLADGAAFVVQGGITGGKVLRVDPDGTVTTLVDGLPGMGDHHTNGPVVGPDGMVYFGQGSATNSGYVGPDDFLFGWVSRRPDYHDVPCADVRLTGIDFTTPDLRTDDPDDTTTTGAYSAFGQPSTPGQRVPGQVPCTGAVMRVAPTGGPVELVAWGFRNPFGLAFSPGGRLYVTDNAYDERGDRPVFGTGDWLWSVEMGAWYGWPDFAGGLRVDDPRYHRPGTPLPLPVLADEPDTPPQPIATFAVHASADGLAVASNNAFGFVGQAFVAEFGDMAPGVGKVLAPVGRRVDRVDLATGAIVAFAVTAPDSAPGAGLERPVDVAFDPTGEALYVVDFGRMTMEGKVARPMAGSGVVWRISRVEE